MVDNPTDLVGKEFIFEYGIDRILPPSDKTGGVFATEQRAYRRERVVRAHVPGLRAHDAPRPSIRRRRARGKSLRAAEARRESACIALGHALPREALSRHVGRAARALSARADGGDEE